MASKQRGAAPQRAPLSKHFMLGRILKIIFIDEREAYRLRYHSHGLSKAEIREKVLSAYGAACACCGETLERVLTIDHVTPCGKRRNRSIWRQVLTEGCPDSYQVLCYNCNQAKGDKAECPHGSHKAA
jgi:5-methylcytosine-specific restriction endonuclease McrA